MRGFARVATQARSALARVLRSASLGKISIDSRRAKVTYNIIAKNDKAKIIMIFSEYNLNSTKPSARGARVYTRVTPRGGKHLNFLVFKEAFALYISGSRRNLAKLKPRILEIINEMNTKRIDFTMPSNHYKITLN
jgi:hypothetical protein